MVEHLPPLANGFSRLYLCRHGETDYNRIHRFQGRGVDMPLNRRGKKQAFFLALAVQKVPLKAIYSSSLTRAMKTAAVIASYHPHVIKGNFEELEEMSFGDLEGHLHAQHIETVRDIHDKWKAGNYDATFPSGECPNDVVKRGVRTIHEIMAQSVNEHVLIVTHGRFNKIILSYLVHETLEKMHEFPQDNTCINVLDYDISTGKYSVLRLNDTSHLDVDIDVDLHR